MHITLFYAGLLALIYLVLSVRVVQGRMGPGKPGLGDGGDMAMQRRIRGHGNFSEYVPLFLVILAMLESAGLAPWLLHALGGTLVVARGLHGYALSYTEKWKFGRFYGALLTFVLLLVIALLALWVSVMPQS